MIHVDFSENYDKKQQSEIQSVIASCCNKRESDINRVCN